MNIHEELSAQQLKTIPHLLKAASIEEGCRRARVSRSAVYHWLDNESFREELRRQREQLTTIAFEALGASVLKASAVLVNLLQSPKDHVRLKAAETIVRLARRLSAADGLNNGEKPAHLNGADDLRDLLTPEQLEQFAIFDRMRQSAALEAEAK